MTVADRLRDIIDELLLGGITLRQAADSFEDLYIRRALNMTAGNATQASAQLNVHRNTLINKRRKYDPERSNGLIEQWKREAEYHADRASRINQKIRAARRRR